MRFPFGEEYKNHERFETESATEFFSDICPINYGFWDIDIILDLSQSPKNRLSHTLWPSTRLSNSYG
jgi:hypothetical protein